MFRYIKTKPLLAALALSNSTSVMLLLFRMFKAEEITYIFLIWNLFLAWIPLILTLQLEKKSDTDGINLRVISLFGIWLLFFPNSPYIITDLIHLKPRLNIPLWFDIVLIISFAWNGLMMGFVSLLKIHRFLIERFSVMLSWTVIISMLVLSSFGVYLGRFLRWNSWDIIMNPFSLLNDISSKLFHPFSHPQTMGVTLVFSFFLITSYLTIYVLNNGKEVTVN